MAAALRGREPECVFACVLLCEEAKSFRAATVDG